MKLIPLMFIFHPINCYFFFNNELSVYLKFSIIEKEDFIQETMNMDISAKLSIRLAISVPLSIEGHGAYMLNDDSTYGTKRLILSFQKISFIEEIPKQFYISKQEFLNE